MKYEEIRKYTELVYFLGKVLGPDTEVVLQDICKQNARIVAIANGHVSGRKIGDAPSDFIFQMINNKEYTDSHRLNFSSVAHGGKVLRSSTYFMRDEDKNLKGMLCINMDVSKYIAICEQIKQLSGIENLRDESVENKENIYLISVKDAIWDHISSVLREMSIDIPLSRLTAKEKQNIVVKLHEQGVFNLKGAVTEVVRYLEVSEPTIYRYLNKAKTLGTENSHAVKL